MPGIGTRALLARATWAEQKMYRRLSELRQTALRVGAPYFVTLVGNLFLRTRVYFACKGAAWQGKRGRGFLGAASIGDLGRGRRGYR